jgi:hypothetical protein
MRRAVGLVAATLLVTAPAAGAKGFGPGDVRVCGASACVPITARAPLRSLIGFYGAGPHPAAAPGPALGSPSFELRFRNGYATGIVATTRLDRFLSYGVHLGWFRRGAWYRVPPDVALELRRLAATLRPLPVTRGSLAKSH